MLKLEFGFIIIINNNFIRQLFFIANTHIKKMKITKNNLCLLTYTIAYTYKYM